MKSMFVRQRNPSMAAGVLRSDRSASMADNAAGGNTQNRSGTHGEIMATDAGRVNILLIQNHPRTLTAVEYALESNGIRCQLLMVRAGPGTLGYLRREGSNAKAPVPDLVLFDLTDTSARSIAVLKAIKADKRCRTLPLVLLTCEGSEEEVVRLTSKTSKESGFAPIELDGFMKAMRSFKSEQFMHAVKLLEGFGFLLIRMPDLEAESAPMQQSKVALQSGS